MNYKKLSKNLIDQIPATGSISTALLKNLLICFCRRLNHAES